LPEVDVRRAVTVAVLAFISLCDACGPPQRRDRGGVSTDYSADRPVVRQAVRDSGPWMSVGSPQREQLDTTTITRSDSNVYEGWVRRPSLSAQGARESYRIRYEVDCLAGLVRTRQVALYGEKGELKQVMSPAEIAHSGDARWSAALSRNLLAVARAICDRVRNADLPISRGRSP
jgi:hypothetical protein